MLLDWGCRKLFEIFIDKLIQRNFVGIILQVSELIAR